MLFAGFCVCSFFWGGEGQGGVYGACSVFRKALPEFLAVGT